MSAKPSRELIVQKYGGTSLSNPQRIRQCAENIVKTRAQGYDLIVVVSAMGQTTDSLLDLAHQISKNPVPRELDMLLTAGERVSMALMGIALSDLGVPAVSLTGSQMGLITDGLHRNARIKKILGDRVAQCLLENKIVIAAGFQGVSEEKEITTLGRGGSDTTAVALAARFKAKVCEIYTDVDGVFTADPSTVPDAQKIKNLSYQHMQSYSEWGSGVLHSRSVALGARYAVPIHVRSSFDFSKTGTWIIESEDQKLENSKVLGVTSLGAISMVEVTGSGLENILESFGGCIEKIKRIRTFGKGAESGASFLLDESDRTEVIDKLEKSQKNKLISFQENRKLTAVNVLVSGGAESGSFIKQALESLTKQDIAVKSVWDDFYSKVFFVESSQADRAVSCLHSRFLEG